MYSSGGSALNGLVGGFLLGTDFSRQRRADRTAAEDRARKIRLEDADRRIAAEDRSRAQGIQDLALAEQYGLQYHRPMGVEQLRTGVGESLKTFDDLVVPGARETELRAREMGEVVPDGFTRIGPSQRMRAADEAQAVQERAQRVRSAVARDLGMTPDQLEGYAQYDLLDSMMGGGDPAFTVNVDGISRKVGSEDEAVALRNRLTVPEAPEPADPRIAFDQTNALADDFYREAVTPIEIAQAVTRARNAGETIVGDQTRIIALNKLLDPNSIVREGEFNRVGRAGGFTTRAQWYYSQMKDGRLPDDIRDGLDEEIERQAGAASSAFQPTIDRFTRRAQAFDLDPSQVTFDPFEGLVVRTPTSFSPENTIMREFGRR